MVSICVDVVTRLFVWFHQKDMAALLSTLVCRSRDSRLCFILDVCFGSHCLNQIDLSMCGLIDHDCSPMLSEIVAH